MEKRYGTDHFGLARASIADCGACDPNGSFFLADGERSCNNVKLYDYGGELCQRENVDSFLAVRGDILVERNRIAAVLINTTMREKLARKPEKSYLYAAILGIPKKIPNPPNLSRGYEPAIPLHTSTSGFV